MQKFHSKMTPRSLYTQFPLTEITYAKVCIIACAISDIIAMCLELTIPVCCVIIQTNDLPKSLIESHTVKSSSYDASRDLNRYLSTLISDKANIKQYDNQIIMPRSPDFPSHMCTR